MKWQFSICHAVIHLAVLESSQGRHCILCTPNMNRAVLCCAVLCCAVLCRAVPCRAVRWRAVLHRGYRARATDRAAADLVTAACLTYTAVHDRSC